MLMSEDGRSGVQLPRSSTAPRAGRHDIAYRRARALPLAIGLALTLATGCERGAGDSDSFVGAGSADGAEGGNDDGNPSESDGADGGSDDGSSFENDGADGGDDAPDRGDNHGDCFPEQAWPGQNVCYELPPIAVQVMDLLQSLWGTGPASMCVYDMSMGGSSACGPHTAENAFYCGADDSFGYDASLWNRLFNQTGDFAAVVVLAHEWGHLNQARLNILGQGLPTIYTELHADCQSGIFAAVVERLGWLESGDLCEAFLTFCSLGDPEGTPWFKEDAHGTCAQREQAFRTGYEATAYSADVDMTCTDDPFRDMLEICRPYVEVSSGNGCPAEFPVDCGDGTGCWTAGTLCENAVFTCGGSLARCGPGQLGANCCSGQFITCPAESPFYCPDDGRCYSEMTGCSTNGCDFNDLYCI